jgi:hypothetical protein
MFTDTPVAGGTIDQTRKTSTNLCVIFHNRNFYNRSIHKLKTAAAYSTRRMSEVTSSLEPANRHNWLA